MNALADVLTKKGEAARQRIEGSERRENVSFLRGTADVFFMEATASSPFAKARPEMLQGVDALRADCLALHRESS